MKYLLPLLACASVALADTPPPVAPAEWRLDDVASLHDNGLRGEVVLNGAWLRTVDGRDERAFVPGNAEVKAGTQTLRREFTPPAAWQGRALSLEVGGLTAPGELRLDGSKIADLRAGARFLEFPLPAGEGVRRLEIVTAGRINDDLWLRSSAAPNTTGIEESYIVTSVRQKRVSVQLAGAAAPGTRLALRVSIAETPGGAPVRTFSAETEAGPDGRWSAAPASGWENPRLWSRYHPHLYYYTVELADDRGRVVDRLLPRRFGFREVWIEHGQFYLNGVQTNYTGDSWDYQVDRAGNAHPEVAEAFMRSMKAQGATFARTLRSPLASALADEIGLLQFRNIGSLVRINVWDPKSGLTPMTGNENVEDILRTVRRFRESPSLLAWISSTAYSQASMHPDYSGRPYETWNFFPLNRDAAESRRAQLLFRQVQDRVAAIDPTRQVVCHNGPFTSVDLTTRYLTNNLDLQEREEFFESWSHADTRQVVSISEFGTPFAGEFYLRRIDHQMPNSPGFWPKLHLEMAARAFGDSVYRDEPTESLDRWTTTRSLDHHANPIYQRVVAESVRNHWRAWRTYGVNAIAHHILDEDGFTPVKDTDAARRSDLAPSADPRRPGFALPGSLRWPLAGREELLPTGRAYLEATRPLLAYIGGADGRFVTKDHLYYAGAEVRKAAIVLNDYDDPAVLRGAWSLEDSAGRAVAGGKIDGTLPPGLRALTEFPITFTAPTVAVRTDYTLKLNLTSDLPGTLTDTFALTVFPAPAAVRPPLPAFAGTVWMLNLSDDYTHESPHFALNRDNEALLRAAGLDPRLVKGLRTFAYKGASPQAAAELHKERALVEDGTPKPGDLLIIPRHTLSTGHDDRQLNVRLLERLGLDALVEAGLRVLVFEQDLPNLLGLNTEDVRPRRAFISASGHPVFAGLEDSDLSYWTGASDLQDAVTAMSSGERRFPERLWHTSNTNAVASRTLLRPQIGAARALAVSGFDLQETPLLEVTRGKGRILFCQFDVSSRYGLDPAATRLVDNLIRYSLTAPEPDPAKASVARADTAEVKPLRNLYRAAKPAGSDGWGITAGELFFRESLYRGHWDKNPQADVPVFAATAGDALPAVIRRDAQGRFELTLDESDLQTGWGRRKIAWLRAALIVNQGGSRPEGPGIAHHGRLTDLYPNPWVEGFVHPYTANIW